MIKVAILTTDTLHHTHFVNEISKGPWITQVLVETRHPKKIYETHHEFETLREEYEKNIWFGNENASLLHFKNVGVVENINSDIGITWLKNCGPDIAFVFGTGILKLPAIDSIEGPFLNLHGGDPERYRGLDSHLWSIYHRDLKGLVTCLHRLTTELDGGDIVEKVKVPLKKDMVLYELRAANTQVCIQLAKNALFDFSASGKIKSSPQTAVGRNYGAMPSSLKSVCAEVFPRLVRAFDD